MPFLTGNLFLCCAFFGLSPWNDKEASLPLSFVSSRIPEWRNKKLLLLPTAVRGSEVSVAAHRNERGG